MYYCLRHIRGVSICPLYDVFRRLQCLAELLFGVLLALEKGKQHRLHHLGVWCQSSVDLDELYELSFLMMELHQ